MRENDARTRMWLTMRHQRRFSVADLQAICEVGKDNAGNYIRALNAEGYLRVVVPKREGVPGGHPVYMLVKDTGPHAPRIGKQGLRDPNIEPHAILAEEKPVTITRREYERALCCVRACAGMANPEREVAALRQAVQS